MLDEKLGKMEDVDKSVTSAPPKPIKPTDDNVTCETEDCEPNSKLCKNDIKLCEKNEEGIK